ncbi:DUF11 domain-containing protein [Microlunatus flavus]|uniref:Conserved repeat domain-containing protein n=1 Tax=Microlunatus flavus TaxID=1036181 RepID=A0A1H9N6G4_9ACTN|nr:DUF11 domain-containing protein [Microlunatus flavus]SER31013.1 conserved repeat domain-containing protein [Microlunatus flavus]
MTTARRPLARSLTLVAAAVLGLLGVAGTGASASADASTPQLSIAVDDGRTEVEGGAELGYRLTLTNLGGSRVRDLTVTQTLPPRTTLASSSKGGARTADGVRWTVEVPAGGSVTLRSSVALADDLPADLLRLATVVCARTAPKAAPTVCASDSDQLPAGATAAEQQQRLDAPAASSRPSWLLPVGLGAVAVLLVTVLVPVVARLRAGRPSGRRAHGSETTVGTGPGADG